MNEYLDDVLEAIQRVDVHYFKWDDFGSEHLLDKEEMLERVFCYEFYHQFRKIMECKNNKYHKLRLNGEIKKGIALGYQSIVETIKKDTEEIKKDTEEVKDSQEKDRYPDFVLHEAQETDNIQELVIEVKTKNNLNSNNLLYDLLKIDAMISQLKFKSGFFIVENMDNKELRNKIKTVLGNLKNKDIDIKNLCKIYFIATDSVRDDKCQEKFFMLNEQD